MKHALRSILIVVAAASLVRCILAYDSPVASSATGLLVADGVITDQETVIILTKTFGVSGTAPNSVAVSGAKIVVESDSGQRFEAVQMGIGTGRYVAQTGTLDENTLYRLYISYDGEEYVSEYRRPQQTPPIDNLELYRDDDNYLQLRVNAKGEPDGPKHFLWSYEENWEVRAEFDGLYYLARADDDGVVREPSGVGLGFWSYYVWMEYSDGREVGVYKRSSKEYSDYYYCWDSARSRELLLGTTEMLTENTLRDHVLYEYPADNRRFSYLYHTQVTQHALGPDAYYYFSNLKKNTDEMGGIFAPIPSEVKGNIVCISSPEIPIVGFMEVSKMAQHGQYFDKMGDIWPCRAYFYYEMRDRIRDGLDALVANDLFLARVLPGENLLFASIACIDCREAGGTKIRPEWWPNDHR